MWDYSGTSVVPIPRVVQNLEEKAKREPTNETVIATLARVHSMAYGYKISRICIDDASGAPFKPWARPFPLGMEVGLERSARQKRKSIATAHLNRAIECYQRAVALVPTNAITHLGLGWCLEQKGEKLRALESYRRALALAWEEEKPATLSFSEDSFRRLGGLAEMLTKHSDAISLFVVNSFDDGLRAALANYAPGDDDTKLRKRLADAFNKLAQGPLIYTPGLFPSDSRYRFARRWLESNSAWGEELVQLNKWLLQRAFWGYLQWSGGSLFFRAMTVEIVDYILPLLDAEKDAAEIERLEKYKTLLEGGGLTVTPLIVSLSGAPTLGELVDPDSSVVFDLDGTGVARKRGWITPKAGWLVYDANDSGKITSGRQMFGSVTFWLFWRNGYEALASLDDNQDGWIDGAELEHLKIWRDENSNGVSEPGEVLPVAEWGITAISVRHETGPDGVPTSPAGLKMRDGSTRPTWDVILPKGQSHSEHL